ncbi:MAG: Glycosyl transferase family 2 [candidate division WWE3 bacterium GW2011_GWF2_41_45]|uniref:Glycosyltransferase 2-like domain-containing protein n=3 Tax=Katanobacteria TaxID=422282 RepID=A0A1F4W3U0_UNCKA|nr:MAG: Glycosyl transferase family 2 [candidate division WWE3 bacterium GW2011_GWC2_41_23]KKS10354.1 MAG: Glycosyl transferase family 2 [candidate division WWE3 bacterium GW2011_GWF2_41_45]KKS26985.1 MAG: Beta-1,3-glucosyltransferase [candidate division WWE3 bacterium GW2011_GWC1_42_102]KKS28304.1 MAG: Glycosyl transferase family 2 [candidate division WWE3 bacterium GW2011_GWD2_42_11]KKS50424.1 MAG: Glycosyl transferase family 2 [candidate division WWE3 bacterium GW2011_GWE2_42_25]KKS59741.1 
MKYSVVIPTLNEEKYIGILLQSLVEQRFKDFEVIVVDAVSEDKTKQAVKEFDSKLALTFTESPKRGVSFQRNYGAKLAKAPHLIFFDADVAPEPEFISKIDLYIEKEKVDVLSSWNVPISDKLVDEFLYWAFNQLYLETVKDRFPAAVGTFIYANKSSFNAVGGFQEEVKLAEDFDLVGRMFKAGYKYALLKDPKIKFSVRRLEKEGRVQFVWKNIRAAFDYHLRGVGSLQGKYKHEFGKFDALVTEKSSRLKKYSKKVLSMIKKSGQTHG